MKGVTILLIFLISVAFLSLTLYPFLTREAQLSPLKDNYQNVYTKAPQEAKELCGGHAGELLKEIGVCRSQYARQEEKCLSLKDTSGCSQEAKKILGECVSYSVKKNCPGLLN